MTSFVSGESTSAHWETSLLNASEGVHSLVKTPNTRVPYKEVRGDAQEIIENIKGIDAACEATLDLLNVHDVAMSWSLGIGKNPALKDLSGEMIGALENIDNELLKRGTDVKRLLHVPDTMKIQSSIQIEFQDADDIAGAINVWKAFFDRLNPEELKVESGVLVDWLQRNRGSLAVNEAASAIEDWCTLARQKINKKMTSRGMFAKKDKCLWGGTDLVVQNVSDALQAALGL